MRVSVNYFCYICRLSRPLKALQNDKSDTSLWMTNLLDRYKQRPTTPQFTNMSLAHFASNYEIITSAKAMKNMSSFDKLLDGTAALRKRRKTAVIRFRKFHPEKFPEKHYASLLCLYLPHRGILLPPQYSSYAEYYSKGTIALAGNKQLPVSSIVKSEMINFTKTFNMEEILDDMSNFEQLEDAWQIVAPSVEEERLSQQEEGKDQNDENPFEPMDMQHVLSKTNKSTDHAEAFAVELNRQPISSQKAYELKAKLNLKQQLIFNYVRKWCIDSKNSENPKPLRLFITGGAGKKFIIHHLTSKAIIY